MTTIPSLVIGIAGGSGAGKTTLAKRLYQELGGEENVTYLIHDCYYKDISDKPFEVRAKTNFDHPESLETDLLLQHIKDLKKGLAAQVPTYDFATHSRTTHREEMQPKKIILVEGILIFCHPELTDQMDVKVYVDAESDIRLARRLSRDCSQRGRTVEDVIAQYHETVKPMHEEYVEPSKQKADLIVHSTGHSIDVAIQMLTNHVRVVTGIVTPTVDAAAAATKLP